MEGNLQKQKKEKIRCKCISCGKDVEVTLISYGDGFIATCPDCGNLAYNVPEKPKESQI
ncbi:MAG: hypothetical protein AAB595_02610 [Patescibacteria group bacterium]